MSDLKNNNQDSENVSEKPTLCTNCLAFFGNKQTNGLCSKCFKETSKSVKKEQPAKEEVVIKPVKQEIFVEKAPEEIKVEEKTELVKKEAPSTNKCNTCSKKTGILGFSCKCGFNFCKNHRLPEDHDCSYDHKAQGKEKLAKDNQAVIGSKLEKF